ncbi:MAG: DUF1553 domain-containing protein [Pirellulales bacterium]
MARRLTTAGFATRVAAILLAILSVSLPGACLAEQPAGAAAEQPLRFDEQIRPLLSDRCLKCHGPDEAAREADLRLDTREGATADLGGSTAIVPGKPDQSELVRRILTDDPDEQMPPPDSGKTLAPDEKKQLVRWIREGAVYQTHWSLVPLRQPPVPSVRNSEWSCNPIDRFVLARLEQEGLQPSPEADRPRLVRRLSYDLTGLPPTPNQVDAFLRDTTPGAYERLVDRLIDSPHYGERMAVDWLDLARYADTYGYQADVARDVWPWRDWVIRALNDNLSYDQFITWQIAGDLLPNATRDQRLATAFCRLHRQTNEGGSIEEEFRAEYVADRTNTLGTAVLGMTIKCARCHEHKYDPISQQDYYRLFAFFNSIDESGLYSHFTSAVPTPTLWLTDPERQQEIDRLARQIEQAQQTLEQIPAQRRDAFRTWLAEAKPSQLVPGLVGDYPFDTIDDSRTENLANADRPARLDDGPKLVAGRFGQAVKLSGDNRVVLEGVGEWTRADPFSFSLWIQTPDEKERAVIFHRSRSWTDAGSRGYQLLIEQGKLSASLIHFWPGNALRIRATQALPVRQWVHVAIVYDGSSRADGLRPYMDGRRVEVETVRDHLVKQITGGGKVELTIGERFRDRGFKQGLVDEFRVFDRCLTDLEVSQIYDGQTLQMALERKQADQAVFDYYLSAHDPVYRQQLDRIGQLRREYNRQCDTVSEIMVMQELPRPRATFLLRRGAYDAPGEQVAAGVPEAILPFSKQLPHSRLGLARWLTDPRHPLVARVEANRLWQTAFGQGLVATPEDFGSQGAAPTHPQLLDWLAYRFIHSGWDVKRMLRLIVTSATYRQSSVLRPPLDQRDAENRLLARGPSHRLPAEMIRDTVLAASGLLIDRIGGPAVKPYQPVGLWKEKSGKAYVPDEGAGLYRRSVYTFWKRTSPPPAMMAFDAAKRDVCVARRQTTSTPMQALVVLNDPQFVEAARVLAQRLFEQEADLADSRLDRLFRILTSRPASREERTVLRNFYQEQLALFREHPERARALLEVGQTPWDQRRQAAELAATTVVAGTLFGFDETMTKR